MNKCFENIDVVSDDRNSLNQRQWMRDFLSEARYGFSIRSFSAIDCVLAGVPSFTLPIDIINRRDIYRSDPYRLSFTKVIRDNNSSFFNCTPLINMLDLTRGSLILQKKSLLSTQQVENYLQKNWGIPLAEKGSSANRIIKAIEEML